MRHAHNFLVFVSFFSNPGLDADGKATLLSSNHRQRVQTRESHAQQFSGGAANASGPVHQRDNPAVIKQLQLLVVVGIQNRTKKAHAHVIANSLLLFPRKQCSASPAFINMPCHFYGLNSFKLNSSL